MDNIQVQITLYSVEQAVAFLQELKLKRSDTWLRKQMRAHKLAIYRVGNSDFVTETDLYKLSRLPPLKRGPKKRETK